MAGLATAAERTLLCLHCHISSAHLAFPPHLLAEWTSSQIWTSCHEGTMVLTACARASVACRGLTKRSAQRRLLRRLLMGGSWRHPLPVMRYDSSCGTLASIISMTACRLTAHILACQMVPHGGSCFSTLVEGALAQSLSGDLKASQLSRWVEGRGATSTVHLYESWPIHACRHRRRSLLRLSRQRKLSYSCCGPRCVCAEAMSSQHVQLIRPCSAAQCEMRTGKSQVLARLHLVAPSLMNGRTAVRTASVFHP